MLRIDISLLPSGRLSFQEEKTSELEEFTGANTPQNTATSKSATGGDAPKDTAKPVESTVWHKRIAKAFSSSQEAGLFALAAAKPGILLSPPVSFWRDFASRYLTELCRTPEGTDTNIEPIEPPEQEELQTFVSGAPPMRGGEYLKTGILENRWRGLDTWTRNEIEKNSTGFSNWLNKNAPLWHQVGRVCFHLVENKRDPECPFAFLATYAPRLSKTGRIQHQPLSKALEEYAGTRNKKALIRLLSPVYTASQRSSFLKELVDSGDCFQPLAWTPRKAYCFLKDVHIFEESGIHVRLPDWWKKRTRPRISVTIGNSKQSRFGAGSILDFNVKAALNGQTLSKSELEEILESREGLVFLRGQWVEANPEKLSQALEHWKNIEAQATREGISFIEGMRMLAGAPADLKEDVLSDEEEQDWSRVTAGGWLSKMLEGLRDPGGLKVSLPGKSLHGSLREYQETGYKWLWFLSSLGLGACLADDMGLGKTIQVISLLLNLKKEKRSPHKPSLLVLPASLLGNWKQELNKFAPTLTTRFAHLSETTKSSLEAMGRNPGKKLSNVDVVLTTYGMLLRQEWIQEMSWRLVVLDEAQAIKNPAARQTRAVKKLKCDSRIVLTGTPIENQLGDLWSLFDFLCPGLLGSATKFKQFVKILETRKRKQYGPLRNLVAPYILRRLKTDKQVINDLPDKIEVKAYCGLSAKQASLYAASVRELTSSLEGLDFMKRRGLVLAYLMRFKQICNHPSQYLGDGEYDAKKSGKFDRLKEICREISLRQEKVLVFTQFREMTEPLAAFLSGIFGREGLVLHGGTAVKKRKILINQFQDDAGPPFFVLSLKAGGTGVNLTAASHVIHFDRWWNPAVENQATDRAFRIGQKQNVMVHKFVCRGTIEEKIDALISEKTGLAQDILGGDGGIKLTELDNKELIRLVSLDVERAKV